MRLRRQLADLTLDTRLELDQARQLALTLVKQCPISKVVFEFAEECRDAADLMQRVDRRSQAIGPVVACRFRRDRPGNPIINRPLFRELTGRDSENYPARAGVGSGSCFWMS
jgi:hypothetical protein